MAAATDYVLVVNIDGTIEPVTAYYRCRATYHTATGPKQCSAPYIPYAKLKAAVWDTITRGLEKPDVVLAEMRRLKDAQKSPTEDDVALLKREIKRCKEQESRLVRL